MKWEHLAVLLLGLLVVLAFLWVVSQGGLYP
jgi:hypothetical protein